MQVGSESRALEKARAMSDTLMGDAEPPPSESSEPEELDTMLISDAGPPPVETIRAPEPQCEVERPAATTLAPEAELPTADKVMAEPETNPPAADEVTAAPVKVDGDVSPRPPAVPLASTTLRSPRAAASEAAQRVTALATPRSPAATSLVPAGPAMCERCTKAGVTPSLRCFARVSGRCRSQGGYNASAARWHHVSPYEHFCHDCVEHYGRGEARREWQAHQAHGKCSFKELVVKLHLPGWARCTRPECGKWRAVPAQARPWELPEEWHCAELDDLVGGAPGAAVPADGGGGGGAPSQGLSAHRSRRKPCLAHRGCDVSEEALASAAEPAEDKGQAVDWVAGGASEAEVKAAAAEARMPWWDLSRIEAHAIIGTGLESHPCRFVALRNLLLWLWRQRRSTGWISRKQALRAIGGAGLQRLWYSAALPQVYWIIERLGLINFGATERLALRIPRPAYAAARKTIVVVGAGLAGLCAAQQLRRFGHRVIVLEAQSRPGGRVLTEEVGGVPIDLGAMLLVGTLGNPLVTLCEQVGCALHTLDRSKCPLFDGDAEVEPKLDERAEGKFNAIMTKASEQRAVRKGKRAMLGVSNGGRWEPELIHHENSEAATAAAAAAAAAATAGASGSWTSKASSGGHKRRKAGSHAVKSEADGGAGAEADAAEAAEAAAAAAAQAAQAAALAAAQAEAEAAAAAEAEAEAQAAADRARNTWLGCDLCGKWRRVGKMKGGALPERWTCEENPDATYASCEVAQELPDHEIDRLLGLLPSRPKAARAPKAEKPRPAAGMPGVAPPVCGSSLGEVLDTLVEKSKLPADEARARISPRPRLLPRAPPLLPWSLERLPPLAPPGARHPLAHCEPRVRMRHGSQQRLALMVGPGRHPRH